MSTTETVCEIAAAQAAGAFLTASSEFFFEDAPQPTIYLNLKKTPVSLWKSLKDSTAGMTWFAMIRKFQGEKAKILEKAQQGEKLSCEEIDVLNKIMYAELHGQLGLMESRMQNSLRIELEDEVDVINIKLVMAANLNTWLGKLGEWLVKKFQAIWEAISKGVKFCMERMKDLFGVLHNFFADSVKCCSAGLVALDGSVQDVDLDVERVPCDDCEDAEPAHATTRCETCNTNMCPKHLQSHHTAKSRRGHKMVRLVGAETEEKED